VLTVEQVFENYGENENKLAVFAVSRSTGLASLYSAAAQKYGTPNPPKAPYIVNADGGGDVIATGIEVDFEMPECTLTSVRIVTDQVGTIELDLWKKAFANFPPTSGDSIASDLPTVTASTKFEDTSLGGWTTAINKGDWIRTYVNSCTTITKATISLGINI